MASSNTVVFCRLNKRTTLSKLDANAGKRGLFRIPRILQWIKAAGQKDRGTQILLPKEGRKVIWRQMEAINFSAKHDDSTLFIARSPMKNCVFLFLRLDLCLLVCGETCFLFSSSSNLLLCHPFCFSRTR